MPAVFLLSLQLLLSVSNSRSPFSIADIIFCIFIYQRYIYRVDPKRMNEFGTSADMFDSDGKIIPNISEGEGEGDQLPAIEKSSEDKKQD